MTLKYWQELGGCINQAASLEKANTAQSVAGLNRIAQQIQSLSTRGVDAEAVSFGLTVSNWYQDAASHRSAADSPGLLIESFIRGFGGDPFGTYGDVRQSESILLSRYRAMVQQSAVIRASLTARYDYEFPSL